MTAISASDLVFYYTNTGNSISATSLALGGTIGLNTITDNTSQNIFTDVTGDQSASGQTLYRAIALFNNHADHNLTSAKLWISAYTAGPPDTISIATERPINDPAAIQIIASETVAPSSGSMITDWKTEVVATSSANCCTLGSSIGIGTIAFKEWAGIWLKREVPASATAVNDRTFVLYVQGETSASPYISQVTKEFKLVWREDGIFYS